MALHRLGEHLAGQVRGETLDEIAHEATQEGATTKTDLGHAGLEQVIGVEHHQIRIELGVDRHLGHDAESALRLASDKFRARFEIVETLAAQRNIDLQTATLELLDSLWDEAKAFTTISE